MDIRSLAAIIFLGFTNAVFAHPIELSSDWQSNKFGVGVLRFTYDSQSLDSNPDPQLGRYYNSILALDLVFESMSYHLDTWESNEIDIQAPFLQPSGGTNIRVFGTLIGSDFQKYNMYLGVENYALARNGTDSINELIGRTSDEGSSAIAQIGDPLYGSSTNYLLMRGAFIKAAVSEPGSVPLLSLGLVGVVLMRQRAKARREIEGATL